MDDQQGAQSPMWFGSWTLPGEEGKFWPEYLKMVAYGLSLQDARGKLRSCMNLTHWTRKRGPSTKDRGSKRKKSRKVPRIWQRFCIKRRKER